MKIFCDTSVLVAACIRNHPHYERAWPVLDDIAKGRHSGAISMHSMAELYSTLTSAPLRPKIQPVEAQQLISRNIIGHFEMIAITKQMYQNAIKICTDSALVSGAIYDALILECARKSDADRIYTFNMRDFRRIAPDLAVRISPP